MSCAVELDACRWSARPAAARCAPPSICRSRIRRRGRASRPAPTREADAVDRMHGADAGGAELPPRTAIVLDEVGDLQQRAARRSWRRRHFRRAPAGREMVAAEFLQRRIFLAAAIDRERAARREGAALRQIASATAPCRGFRSTAHRSLAPSRDHGRHRGHQPARVGMLAACRTAPRRWPPRPSCRHTSRSRAARSAPPRRDRA